MIYVWLAVVILSIVIEFLTTDLVSMWFIAGGLVALVFSALKLDLIWQLLTFIVISTLCLIFFRKPLAKLLNKNSSKTNADSNIGKTFTLLTPILTEQPGTIKVNDVVWNVTTETDTEVQAGVKVEVVSIKGNKYIVKEI